MAARLMSMDFEALCGAGYFSGLAQGLGSVRAFFELRAQRRFELPVQEHEGNEAGRLGPIAPGVVRAALDHDIACPHQGFRLVKHEVDLAGQHDRVVDGLGAVDHGMASTLRVRGCCCVAERHELAH